MNKEELIFMNSFEKSFKNLLNGKEDDKDEKIIEQVLTNKYSDAIIKITPYLEKYKNVKNLEMEIRIGYIEEDDSFTTDIGENFFEKIKKTLEKTPIWNNKKSIIENNLFSNGLRMSVDEEGNETVIVKKKLCTLDFTFSGTPFDIRISFSTENNVSIEEFNKDNINYQRHKKRDSFTYKCWDYDVTIVTSEEEVNYEIELEINMSLNAILNKMSPYYFLHSTFLKIEDIANMCEEQEEDNMIKLEFINEKMYK